MTVLPLVLALALQGRGLSFETRFEPGVLREPFSGRLLLFLSKTAREPRTANDLARLDPVIAADFEDVGPGEPMVVDARNALSFPVPLADLEGGTYRVQAVLDVALDEPFPGTAPGNPCSASRTIEWHPGGDLAVELVCDQVIEAPRPRETRAARLFELQSDLLTEFNGAPTVLRALVHLPQAFFDEPERRFPLYLFLSGYGATLEGFDFVDWPAPAVDGVPMVMVYPDPSCGFGHSGFADSANIGPWGRALVTELVPALEEAYRGLGRPEARFLVGHSSGGWSALWLMTRYPDSFGYAWASSPDPVDFRDFMGIDLYAEGANLYRDEAGDLRPFCRIGMWTVGFLKEHAERERVLRGGVLRFFDALFGPRGPDGAPEPLHDRATGALRPAIVEAWSRYDVARLWREQWDALGPKLDGKIAITIGTGDNFMLSRSVELLREDLQRLGADVRIRLVAGDHFSVRAWEPGREELEELADAYRAWRAQPDGD